MARCLAAAINQAPALFGMPDAGHCSSAATSASCARSSAGPTSRTMRARLAMIFVASMRQTATIARWVSVAITATDHTIFTRGLQWPWAGLLLLLLELSVDLLVVLDGRTRSEVFELEERPQLDFPVFERHPLCPLDGLFLRFDLDDP